MTRRVLILTPVKDAAHHLDRYVAGLDRLTYPRAALSLGLLGSDSRDSTFELLSSRLPRLHERFHRVTLLQHAFDFHMPPGVPRWAASHQLKRRTVLARSRNRLLSGALADEDWVLWLDVDVIDYPPDVIERLLATGKELVAPHCAVTPGGRTFDRNAWSHGGQLHLDEMRGGPDLVPLDAVGGTMLLVLADAHRDGLNFPAFPFGRRNPRVRAGVGGGEVETEGLGLMAHDMGYTCWGMPNLEIVHAAE
jgi:Anp1